MKRCFTIFLMIFIHGALFASNFTPNGQSDRYTDLLNPGQTFSGAGVLRDGSLTDTFVNPAVQAFQQRFAFDINYAGIVGHMDGHSENGYPGHAVTLGAGLPSPIGYFTLTGGFYHSSWDDFALGSQGFFNVALGKKVYDELYLGLGLKSVVGGLTGNRLSGCSRFGNCSSSRRCRSGFRFPLGIGSSEFGMGHHDSVFFCR